MVARPDLDQPAAIGELAGEERGKLVHGGAAAPEVVGIVLVAVETGGRDDVQPARPRRLREAVEVAAEADRRPLRDGVGSRRAERACVVRGGLPVVELVTLQQRRHEEQMLVRVAPAELRGLHVAEHRPYPSAHMCSILLT